MKVIEVGSDEGESRSRVSCSNQAENRYHRDENRMRVKGNGDNYLDGGN